MRPDIKKEMLDYFKNKSDRTSQENRFLLYLQNEVESFDVVSVSREDVDDCGYDGANMTDSQMERLADKMGDCYVENGFWEDLSLHLDFMEIPKLNDKADENE